MVTVPPRRVTTQCIKIVAASCSVNIALDLDVLLQYERQPRLVISVSHTTRPDAGGQNLPRMPADCTTAPVSAVQRIFDGCWAEGRRSWSIGGSRPLIWVAWWCRWRVGWRLPGMGVGAVPAAYSRGVAGEAARRRHHRLGTGRPLPQRPQDARRQLAFPRSAAVAMGVLVAKDSNA